MFTSRSGHGARNSRCFGKHGFFSLFLRLSPASLRLIDLLRSCSRCCGTSGSPRRCAPRPRGPCRSWTSCAAGVRCFGTSGGASVRILQTPPQRSRTCTAWCTHARHDRQDARHDLDCGIHRARSSFNTTRCSMLLAFEAAPLREPTHGSTYLRDRCGAAARAAVGRGASPPANVSVQHLRPLLRNGVAAITGCRATPSPPTKSLGFGGFEPSRFLMFHVRLILQGVSWKS